MPQISNNERWSARLDRIGFLLFGMVYGGIVVVFFLGDTLMSARLLLVGFAATYDRFRRRREKEAAAAAFQPAVAVLIPAYNEEKVIERPCGPRCVRIIRACASSWSMMAPRTTPWRWSGSVPNDIAAGRVTLLTKPNAGKADALNFGLEYVKEEIFIGIDADTIIHPKAISLLVPHFSDPKWRRWRGMRKWATASTCGPAGRRWSISPARISSGGR